MEQSEPNPCLFVWNAVNDNDRHYYYALIYIYGFVRTDSLADRHPMRRCFSTKSRIWSGLDSGYANAFYIEHWALHIPMLIHQLSQSLGDMDCIPGYNHTQPPHVHKPNSWRWRCHDNKQGDATPRVRWQPLLRMHDLYSHSCMDAGHKWSTLALCLSCMYNKEPDVKPLNPSWGTEAPVWLHSSTWFMHPGPYY